MLRNSEGELPQSNSHTFLARILQKWYISDTISDRFLQIRHFLARSCKTRHFLARSCKTRHYLPRSFKIPARIMHCLPRSWKWNLTDSCRKCMGVRLNTVKLKPANLCITKLENPRQEYTRLANQHLSLYMRQQPKMRVLVNENSFIGWRCYWSSTSGRCVIGCSITFNTNYRLLNCFRYIMLKSTLPYSSYCISKVQMSFVDFILKSTKQLTTAADHWSVCWSVILTQRFCISNWNTTFTNNFTINKVVNSILFYS